MREEVAQVERWMRSPRFSETRRHHSAADVVALRGSITPTPASAFTAKKLWAVLNECRRTGLYSHTFGALDPVQVIQMAKYLSSVYVSGWQCSSTASSTNEPGPDFADYPMDTVPRKVDQLFRAQLFHDRRQHEHRSRMTPQQRAANPPTDYLRCVRHGALCCALGVWLVCMWAHLCCALCSALPCVSMPPQPHHRGRRHGSRRADGCDEGDEAVCGGGRGGRAL